MKKIATKEITMIANAKIPASDILLTPLKVSLI